jgi:photosystem II stability/assembly factor-like uncharacterized protein
MPSGIDPPATSWVVLLNRYPGLLALLLLGAACSRNTPRAVAPAEVTTEAQVSGTTALLIAVTPVNQRVVWVSGARGTYLRTTDAGVTWHAAQVQGAEHLQFRDVHALDENIAWLLSIGPADSSRIYHTRDAGKSWTLQFTNPVPAAFYDCFDFWDGRRGIAISDAVEGRTVVLSTADGGNHWIRIPPSRLPAALPMEGSLAASGTCLITRPGGGAWIAVTGPKARLLHTRDYGASWMVDTIPLTTIASVSFRDNRNGVVFGSDSSAATAATHDGGRTWIRGGPPPFPRGVYGGVFVPGTPVPTIVSVGPGGSAYSRDDGSTWTSIDGNAYWSVGFASPSAGWAVGPLGRITRIRGF